MATLILNPNTASPITVVCQRAGKGAPRNVGSKSYSFNGAERSSIRGQAKVIPITTSYVDTATEDLIQNAAANGAQIGCSGDILGNIPTLCSFDNVVSDMAPGLVGFFVMSFTLSAVNASVTLLRYSPGDTITGESFSRSTIGTYIDVNGVVQTAAINAKRDGHYINGIRSLLLEGASTNSLLWATDYSNAAWVKTTMTVGTGIADPAGGTTACTLTATGASANVTQTLATSSSIVRANSYWLRRRTGTGTINILTPDNLTLTPVTLTSSWQRFTAIGTASINRVAAIQIVTNGDAIDVWVSQLENAPYATSTIVTTSATVTRGADSYSLPFTTPPQEMSVYAKFVELGTAQNSGARVAEVSSSADASPRFIIQSQPTVYGTYHGNAVAVTSILGTGPAFNDGVELNARLFGDGSTDLTQSLNSAASTSAAQSAANVFASAWSGQLCWLNSGGTAGGTTGWTALRSFKIIAGARSLSEMRAL